jgi:hypothetical protein
MIIADLLKLERWVDLARKRQGVVAGHHPERGILAYDVAINDPLSEKEIEEVTRFGCGANAGMIRSLYSMCNGMRVGRFSVYGSLSGPWGLQQPYDINLPNYYERPIGLPENWLVVGVSDENYADQGTIKLFHAIGPDEKIIVFNSKNADMRLREYTSVMNWLEKEADRAVTASF